MFTTIRLVTISFTSRNYHFVVVAMVRTLKFYSHSSFEVCNTVLLTRVTMLYLRSPELIHLITESLYSSSSSPILGPWLINHYPTLYFYKFDVFKIPHIHLAYFYFGYLLFSYWLTGILDMNGEWELFVGFMCCKYLSQSMPVLMS